MWMDKQSIHYVNNNNLHTTMFAKRFNSLLLGVRPTVAMWSLSPLSNI